MTFKTDYWAVVNAVKMEVEKEETAGTLTDVVIGERTKALSFPIAFVIPIRDPIVDETVAKIRHRVGVRVVIVHSDPDPTISLTTCINAACDVYDEVTDDRTLGGTVEILFPRLFEPQYSIAETKTLSWVVMEFSCEIVRLEG